MSAVSLRCLLPLLPLFLLTQANLEPNLCNAKGTLQCEVFETCCDFSNGDNGCCPFLYGNCCPEKSSCCPAGFECFGDGCRRMFLPDSTSISPPHTTTGTLR